MKQLSTLLITLFVVLLTACGGAAPDGNGETPGDPETLFDVDGTWTVTTVVTQSDTEDVGETFTFEQEITATDSSVTLVGFDLDENDEPQDLVLVRSGNLVAYSENNSDYAWSGEFTSPTDFDGIITTVQTLGDEDYVTLRSVTMTKQP